MSDIANKAYELIEKVHNTNLTAREKVLMHTYYGVVGLMLRYESHWISVEDRLPEHDGRILAYSPQMAGTEAEIQIQKGFMVSRKRSDVSHWMPLPEPPEK